MCAACRKTMAVSNSRSHDLNISFRIEYTITRNSVEQLSSFLVLIVEVYTYYSPRILEDGSNLQVCSSIGGTEWYIWAVILIKLDYRHTGRCQVPRLRISYLHSISATLIVRNTGVSLSFVLQRIPALKCKQHSVEDGFRLVQGMT